MNNSMRTLEEEVGQSIDETRTRKKVQNIITKELSELREVSEEHYAHSLRVGLSSLHIARYSRLCESTLLTTGLLHDIGKKHFRKELLEKKTHWTESDRKEMEQHSEEGYKILQPQLPIIAEIVRRHHHYQQNPYPTILPTSIQQYNQKTQTIIKVYAGHISIADTYDAFHRRNERNGNIPLTEQEIQERMLATRQDQQQLITKLYAEGILGKRELIKV